MFLGKGSNKTSTLKLTLKNELQVRKLYKHAENLAKKLKLFDLCAKLIEKGLISYYSPYNAKGRD